MEREISAMRVWLQFLAFALCVAGATLGPKATNAQTVTGNAAIVIDGDTLDLVTLGDTGPERRRVRLWGMDAPERGEPGARAASAWLALLLAERPGIICEPAEAADQRAGGRLVATCWAGARGTLAESVNCRLITAGAAVEMERFSDGALRGCKLG